MHGHLAVEFINPQPCITGTPPVDLNSATTHAIVGNPYLASRRSRVMAWNCPGKLLLNDMGKRRSLMHL